MTREERLDYYKTIDGLKWGMSLPNVINSIYNDFESRTCENCKHGGENYVYSICPIDDEVWKLPGELGEDFGCNKFEAKSK